METKNLDGYGNPPLDWLRVERQLNGAFSPPTPIFLGTVRPDGRPHAAGVGVVALDGALFFTSSPHARKARNLEDNPACTLAMRLVGIDVMFEGEARRETTAATLERVTAAYNAGGWPSTVQEDALTAPYSAPGAGPPPWHLYRFTPRQAFGTATEEPHGATRWRFTSS